MVHQRHQTHLQAKQKNPRSPSNYRHIALINSILKLWTYILTSIGTQTAEAPGTFSDTADGFRSHRNIYDSLSTHIMMYEDAKNSKRNMYTTYPDFKGAFGGMDRRILFQLMKDYVFQDSYIVACKQLYSASDKYNMTIHGSTAPLPIYRGTLQGDTLSCPLHNLYGTPPTMASDRNPRV